METSIWEKESFYAPKDVVIAGSGFVGLWCAYYLKKLVPKLSIGILDRGLIPTGASTRNAGFACFGSVTELIADTAKMGEDKMLELAEKRFRGLRLIQKAFNDKEIGYKQAGGFELIKNEQGIDIHALRTSIDWLNHKMRSAFKKEKVFRLSDDKLKMFGFCGIDHLVETKLEGQLHPGLLCQSLLRKVQAAGVSVMTNTEITGFRRVNHQIEISTGMPFPFLASQLLICTNAFAKQLVPSLDVEPARGQILVTSPIKDLSFKGCFHFDEGFYYFRNLGNRVLLGGARNKALEEEHTNEMNTSLPVQQELERFLQESILPGKSYTIEHRWSGIMGIGAEKTPVLQEVDAGIFTAVRMGGMGVALAPVVGEYIARKMTGKENK